MDVTVDQAMQATADAPAQPLASQTSLRIDWILAAFEEARSQHTVRGEAQAIACCTERRGHRADEADPSHRVPPGQPIDIRGADAGFFASIDGEQGAELRFDHRADFGFRDERFRATILRPASTRGADLRGRDSIRSTGYQPVPSRLHELVARAT